MTPFDFVRTPIDGVCLIEAGAGTGKTFTIEGLYLRLLLEKELEVDQILVVTFTIAATAELKDRIRRRLLSARKTFSEGNPKDALEASLLDRSSDRDADLKRLQDALADFDRASVFTIHGLCQRLLHDYAFETRSRFDVDLITDPLPLIQETADDFWRREFYDGAPEWIAFVRQLLNGPETLADLFRNRRQPELTLVPRETPPDLDPLLGDYRFLREELMTIWSDGREAIRQCLLDPSLKGNIYGAVGTKSRPGTREAKIDTLMADMDLVMDPRLPGFPVSERLAYFTSSKINASTRKNGTPPHHPFFSRFERFFEQSIPLTAAMDRWLVHLKRRFLEIARRALEKKRARDQVQFFDDLLLNVRSALIRDPDQVLHRAVRERFHAALVDEFQDTDPVQYDIFSRLFRAPDRLFFMIGDPKQAIYGFRGADLFSYLKAARNTDRRYTLLTNWRSTKGLVQAVNTLFSRPRHPFVLKEIGFLPATPAPEPKAALPGPPLVLWYLPGDRPQDGGRPINSALAVERVCEAVAAEIKELTGSPEGGDIRVAPGDVAVLTRTHDQAIRVREALSRLGIPAVLYDAGGVFQTLEALELEQLLRGVATPGNDRAMRTALATSLIGITATDLDFSDHPPSWWEDRIGRFGRYHDLWIEQGFMPMFRQLMAGEQITLRVIGGVDGERRLTNLHHLAELLHSAWVSMRPGLPGLLKWFADQRLDTGVPDDERLVRLESEAAAVTVVTIHRSKGLEYPVVFCPFLWGGSRLRREEIPVFHDPQDDFRAIMDLGSSDLERSCALAEQELLAENLRLAYVALTRASQKCYLAWGRINGAETSALAYLLHLSESLEPTGDQRLTSQMQRRFSELTDADLLNDLTSLARDSDGTVAVCKLPGGIEAEEGTMPGTGNGMLQARTRTRTLYPGWQVASYSSLSASASRGIEPEIDRDVAPVPPDVELSTADTSRLDPSASIGVMADFPAGARAGLFFHELFERIDYTDLSDDRLGPLVDDALRRHGFAASWHRPVIEMLRRTLSTRLNGMDASFLLSDIGPEDRLNELGFYFPLKPVDHRGFRQIYAAHPDFPAYVMLDRRLEDRGFSLSGGYMKGFIDLVFRHSNRFYLLDWKSNRLGGVYPDYHRKRLDDTMGNSGYVLQYHLYTVATVRWLRLQMPDFRYDTHFGGVYYLFFRGMHPRHGSESGVFFDRPAGTLIESLDGLLVAEPAKHRPARIEDDHR